MPADMVPFFVLQCGHGQHGSSASVDQIDGVSDKCSEQKFDPAHGENGDKFIQPAHVGDEHDEKRLIAGGNEYGKERSERHISLFIKLCRHDGETTHGNKSRCSADEGRPFARKRRIGTTHARIVLHELDEYIQKEQKRKQLERIQQCVKYNIPHIPLPPFYVRSILLYFAYFVNGFRVNALKSPLLQQKCLFPTMDARSDKSEAMQQKTPVS